MDTFNVGGGKKAETAVRRLRGNLAALRSKRAALAAAATQAEKVNAMVDYVKEIGDAVEDLIACEIHELHDLLG